METCSLLPSLSTILLKNDNTPIHISFKITQSLSDIDIVTSKKEHLEATLTTLRIKSEYTIRFLSTPRTKPAHHLRTMSSFNLDKTIVPKLFNHSSLTTEVIDEE